MRARAYWESRYASGGDSGVGSQGEMAAQKARFISAAIKRLGVTSVVDWGCGDGNLLSQLDLDGVDYVGVEVSPTALVRCVQVRSDLAYVLWQYGTPVNIEASLALSIDVLFHLTDDVEYKSYLDRLFDSSWGFVLIHTSEDGPPPNDHVKWRKVTVDIAERFPGWQLLETADGVNGCSFYLYEDVR